MIISCVLAYITPFELFLFSYAVLPLHYLTEISWLHDRKYFIEAKRAREKRARRIWLILVTLTLTVMLYGFVAEKILKEQVTPIWEIALFYLVFVTPSQLWFNRKKTTGIAVVSLTLIILLLFRTLAADKRGSAQIEKTYKSPKINPRLSALICGRLDPVKALQNILRRQSQNHRSSVWAGGR